MTIKNQQFKPASYQGLLTVSPVMKSFMTRVERVARSNASILVRGDSGTGKELVAKYIHFSSSRKTQPFNAINCASLSSELMASELFGHKKGAFTGAISDRKGLLELTDGGTLFFDEVAEMPLDIQARLLRVVQDKLYTPVGSSQLHQANIRLVSATHKSLRQLVQTGGFREDLMYRIRVIPLFLPTLIERGDDLPMLIWYFIERFNQESERKITQVETDAWEALMMYSWPGNIRELANVIEYSHAVGLGNSLKLEDINPDLLQKESLPLTETMPVHDSKYLQHMMNHYGGNRMQVARKLGISRTTLWRKLKELDLI